VPYPYTEIYKNMIRTGLLKEDVWLEFALNPQPEFVPPLCEEHVDSAMMYELLNSAYRGFYLRPWYVIKQLFKLSSVKDLLLKAKAAYRIFVVTS
jgi:hypothetical protein